MPRRGRNKYERKFAGDACDESDACVAELGKVKACKEGGEDCPVLSLRRSINLGLGKFRITSSGSRVVVPAVGAKVRGCPRCVKRAVAHSEKRPERAACAPCSNC